MSTKSTPGSFRCYEAALPDEPMFVILGRDPAGPATLHFWAQERIKQGKTKEIDDNARIGACLRESEEMAAWRKKIMDHAEETGEPPAWKLPRPRDEPGDRPVRMEPALGMPYSGYDNRLHTHRELMVSVGKELREIAHGLTEVYRNERLPGEMADFVTKLHGEIERLADAARMVKLSDTDPYAEFAKNLGQPVEHVWHEYDDPENEHPRKVLPLSFSRMAELLDYATAYGEFDENTPSGTQTVNPNASSPMNDMRRAAIWQLKRCMGILTKGAELPVADDRPAIPTVPVYVEGLFAVPNVDQPQTMEQIAETYREAAKHVNVGGVNLATSRDVTEIEQPELPPHRFAMFDKGKGWAYGRGLEINPTHIPAMLDRMEADGYTLVAALGSRADQVGMIFQRGPRYSGFELAHGFGGPTREELERRRESPSYDRFKAGEPLDSIRADDTLLDTGRGQQP